MTAESVPTRIPCPTCKRPVALDDARPDSFPFCSARCRLIDLGAWADGSYVVAGSDPAEAVADQDIDRP